MEELASDEDTDTTGVGLASDAFGHRFDSDPLRFTGVDLGDREGNTRSRKRYARQRDGEGGETSDDSDHDSVGNGGRVRLPLVDPEEEALADAAMARIRRAQERGRTDVKLNKEELAAYQRRLQRLEDDERRQRREKRVAIPIAQLDPGLRRRQSSIVDSPPRQPSPELGDERQAGYPPMGYFPPPSSRSRPRSGTTSSRPPSRAPADRDPSSSPFTYTYVHRPDQPPVRHASDPATGRPLSRGHQALRDSVSSARNGALPSSVPDGTRQPLLDAFQYMAGTRVSYHSGAGSVRNSVQEVADLYNSYASGPSTRTTSRRRSGGDPRDGETSNEDDRHADRVSSSGSGGRGRPRDNSDGRREHVAQPRAPRDRTPPPASKKSSAAPSPVKRKAVSGSSKSSGRKKGK